MLRRLSIVSIVLLFLATACSPVAMFPVQPAAAPALSTNFPISTKVVTSTPSAVEPTALNTASSVATARSTNTSTVLPSVSPTTPAAQTGGVLKVTFIDVGQGDSTLITAPDGKNILIDGGEVDQNVAAKLKGLGVTSIDTIFATHAHADHIGGLTAVVGTIKTRQVIMNNLPYTTKTFENLLDAIQQTGTGYQQVKRGDKFTLGGVSFLVLNPAGDLGDNQNNNSVVLLVTYLKSSFLFMGDAEHEAEASIMASDQPVKADVLKAGHHCSSTSSSPAFVDKVRPMLAVCFVGAGNTYGHPHKETITTYGIRNIPLYVTQNSGTVVVSTDGNTYKIETAKNGVTFSGLAAGGSAPAPRVATIISPSIQATVTPVVAVSGGGSFDVIILAAPGSVNAGGKASVSARTSPSASCSILVTYKSGASKAKGLEPQSADGSGNVSWTWSVGSNSSAGTWPVDVTCQANGASKSTQTQVTVTK